MQRSVLLRLNDIVRAIDGAADTIAGADFETFRSVYHMGRTVERCIEIVSEATGHLPEEIKYRYADIPWHNIAGIGNVLRHDYDIVDDYVIWDVATVHFPRLRAVISDVRAQLSEK